MENLIKEIENCKLKYEYDGSELDCKRSVFNEGIGKVINWLEDKKIPYNILTAPKSIKLSEIVERLQPIFLGCDNKICVNRKGKHIIICNNTTYDTSIVAEINLYNKIISINEDCFLNSLKWLYTLWIAGTEIIDDMKEEE